jgi:hypothetical protein
MEYQQQLSDAFLAHLVAQLNDQETLALALVGSHARGMATSYSDVDVTRFVISPSHSSDPPLQLTHEGGYLISIVSSTFEQSRHALTQPEEAIWVVPALRDAKILLDKEGQLERLQREARAFQWEALQQRANGVASAKAAKFAEEVYKLLGGLARQDEDAILNATLWLFVGLTLTIAVQRGILLLSESTSYRQVRQVLGKDSKWTRLHRQVAGFEEAEGNGTATQKRGIAALHLYEETIHLLRPFLHRAHVDVVHHALGAIQGASFLRPLSSPL